MDSNRPRLDLQMVRQSATLGAVGLEMGFSVVIGYLVGHYLDQWLDTEPVFTIIWICFGLGAAAKAMLMAYKRAKNLGKDQESEKES